MSKIKYWIEEEDFEDRTEFTPRSTTRLLHNETYLARKRVCFVDYIFQSKYNKQRKLAVHECVKIINQWKAFDKKPTKKIKHFIS